MENLAPFPPSLSALTVWENFTDKKTCPETDALYHSPPGVILIVSDEKIETNIPFQTMSYDLALGNSNVILYHLIKMTPIDMSIKKKKP